MKHCPAPRGVHACLFDQPSQSCVGPMRFCLAVGTIVVLYVDVCLRCLHIFLVSFRNGSMIYDHRTVLTSVWPDESHGICLVVYTLFFIMDYALATLYPVAVLVAPISPATGSWTRRHFSGCPVCGHSDWYQCDFNYK